MKKETSLLEKPFRAAYESNAAIAWFIGVGFISWIQISYYSPDERWGWLALSAISAMLIIGTIRISQAFKLWFKRVKLFGGNITLMKPDKFLKTALKNPEMLYLGKGFEWNNPQAQMSYDMQTVNIDEYKPPFFSFAFYNLLHRTNIKFVKEPEKRFKGKTWIHGLGLYEKDIYMPFSDVAGNNLITGTTGSGKTRLYELLVTQLIHKKPNECVIIFDPKGDYELFQRMFKEAQRAGREDDFVFFSSAHTKYSCKIDPLANWAEVSEIASRIESLLPGGTGGDSFTKFAWDVVNAVAGAYVFLGIKPSLAMITDIVDTSPDELVKDCILSLCEKRDVPNWRKRYMDYIRKIEDDPKSFDKPDKLTPTETVAAVYFYMEEVKHDYEQAEVTNIISYYNHNRQHSGKMLAVLKPVLKTLTSGGIRELLSPETSDIDDYRPKYNTRKLISEKKIVYIGINSMGDQTVANSIGSVMLSDLVSSMGARYNHKVTGDHKVNIIVDESSELVNLPFQSLLNKGRGAGAMVFFATQTTPDMVVKLGSEELKDQSLGNANNMYTLRVIDDATKEFVINRFGPSIIRTLQSSQSLSSNSDASQFSSGYGDRSTDAEGEMIPSGLLAKIPDLEMFGVISGGRIVKCRIPIIKTDGEEMPGFEDLPWIRREIEQHGALN